MRRLLLFAALSALALAKPELYKEKEDFHYSRSSSDEGSKSGFYGAQRGNMGGNFERAHNMDSLAQRHLSGAISQVEGELGEEGSKTRTGSVYTAANSAGFYGSGNYDLSNLRGRNFQEGTYLDNAHSSLLSNAQYSTQAINRNSHYSNSQFSNSNYRNSHRASPSQSQHISDLQASDGSQGYQQFDYGGQAAAAEIYSKSNGRVASDRYSNDQNAYDQYNSNALANNEAIINIDTSVHKPKHFQSAYSYHKQWEKHDTKPLIISVPNSNYPKNNDLPIPENSELYEDAVAQTSNQQFEEAGFNSHNHASSINSDYSGQSKSSRNSRLSSAANGDAYNQLLAVSDSKPKTYHSSYSYKKSWERRGDPYVIQPSVRSQVDSDYDATAAQTLTSNANLLDSQRYTHNQHQSLNAINCQICDEHGYIRVPRSYNVNQYFERAQKHDDQQITQQIQNSDDLQQGNNQFETLEDLGQQTQNQWDNLENLGQQTQDSWGKAEDLSQQTQNNFDKLEDLGQQTQNHWGKLEDLGQQTQNQWDNLENLGQQTQDSWGKADELSQQTQTNFDKLEDLGQQTQNHWGKLEDLGQQTQNQWDNLENLGQQTQDSWGKADELSQQTQTNFDKLEDLGQQTQKHWGKLEDLGQQTQNQRRNLENLGQQTQDSWGKAEDLSQQTQNNFDKFEDLGQQTQNQWGNLENFGQQTQDNWDKAKDLSQQTQNNFDKLESFGQQTHHHWNSFSREQNQHSWNKLENGASNYYHQTQYDLQSTNNTARDKVTVETLGQPYILPSSNSQIPNDNSPWNKINNLGPNKFNNPNQFTQLHVNGMDSNHQTFTQTQNIWTVGSRGLNNYNSNTIQVYSNNRPNPQTNYSIANSQFDTNDKQHAETTEINWNSNRQTENREANNHISWLNTNTYNHKASQPVSGSDSEHTNGLFNLWNKVEIIEKQSGVPKKDKDDSEKVHEDLFTNLNQNQGSTTENTQNHNLNFFIEKERQFTPSHLKPDEPNSQTVNGTISNTTKKPVKNYISVPETEKSDVGRGDIGPEDTVITASEIPNNGNNEPEAIITSTLKSTINVTNKKLDHQKESDLKVTNLFIGENQKHKIDNSDQEQTNTFEQQNVDNQFEIQDNTEFNQNTFSQFPDFSIQQSQLEHNFEQLEDFGQQNNNYHQEISSFDQQNTDSQLDIGHEETNVQSQDDGNQSPWKRIGNIENEHKVSTSNLEVLPVQKEINHNFQATDYIQQQNNDHLQNKDSEGSEDHNQNINISTTPETVTEKPGFWKSVGSKLNNVYSWFSSS
ncbi:putative uncharacterized protein DDB_G0282133 isoform X1 [Bombyx mandarina]|uniref:GATA zinc finger domain-containing protein 14-like n=1 Tax=Bombyx mandarina TaxID=7092 RepID=A0A6J2JW84_BOMMA|nr:putative uncharacterized protein DDB_G0282133 isoform X1 [Bombyx mandarina]